MNLPNKPKVLAATYNPVSNTKMISFLVDFPTVLLAELRTHRILTQGSLYEHSELIDFNLSANSARAIPANKYLQKILNNPFIPIWTGKQSGMSGSVVTKDQKEEADFKWACSLQDFLANQDVSSTVYELIELGIHKQNANRLLAPFAYTTCILSGTEWDNFFELRCPKYHTSVSGKGFYAKSKKELISWHSNKENLDKLELPDFDWQSINSSSAQPEFQVIAEMLYDLYQETEWKQSKYHIPFEDEIEEKYYDKIMKYISTSETYVHMGLAGYIDYEYKEEDYYNILMKISASMCAKLSYNTQDNEDTLEKHLDRANMLIEHKHSEPFSHQAVAMTEQEYFCFLKTRLVSKNNTTDNFYEGDYLDVPENKVQIIEYGKCYNLTGFISQRYILENY